MGGDNKQKNNNKQRRYYETSVVIPIQSSSSTGVLPKNDSNASLDSEDSLIADLYKPTNTTSTLSTATHASTLTGQQPQGVTTMLKATNQKPKDFEDDFDDLALEDKLPTAAQKGKAKDTKPGDKSAETNTQKTKADIICATPAGKAFFDLMWYVYHEKGLTKETDKSYLTQGTHLVTSFFSTPQKYDGTDARAKHIIQCEEQIIAALMNTKAEDPQSRKELLEKLQAVKNSFKGDYAANRSYKCVLAVYVQAKEKLSAGKDPEEAKKFVIEAQGYFRSNPVPDNNALTSSISKFVKEGQVSQMSEAIVEKIDALPKTRNKPDEVNQREGKLNYLGVQLEKAQNDKSTSTYPMLHTLYTNLNMLNEMRKNYTHETDKPEEHINVFQGRVSAAMATLLAPQQQNNATKLNKIASEDIPQLADQIITLINGVKDYTQPSDPVLTKAYLEELKKYATSPAIKQNLGGYASVPHADIDLGSSYLSTSSVKKMNNQ